MSIEPVTPDSLQGAPREYLSRLEQDHAAQLVRKGRRPPYWNEYQRRYAGALQAKAHRLAQEKGKPVT